MWEANRSPRSLGIPLIVDSSHWLATRPRRMPPQPAAVRTRARRGWLGRAARRLSSRSFWWTSAAWPVFDLLEFLGPQQHDVDIVDKERPTAVAAAEGG